MSEQLEKMYRDIFADRGVVPCDPVPEFNQYGEFYKMDPEKGKGYCWVYRCNPHVTITIMDQVHYEDTCCVFQQPEYMCRIFLLGFRRNTYTLSPSYIRSNSGICGKKERVPNDTA